MYKESLNGYEPVQKTSKKGVIALFLAGTACVAVGMAGYNAVQEQTPEYMEFSGEADLATTFYEQIANQCNAYYHGSSVHFAEEAVNFNKEINFAHKHKLIMARYANEQFHKAKGAMIDELDDLRDAQREIEGTTTYLNRTVRKMGSKINGGSWKFNMKYSTMFNKKCARDAQKLKTRHEFLEGNQMKLADNLKTMGAGMKAAATEDVKKWDCLAMYPKPEKFEVDWIGIIQDAGKQGFEVYNQVKDMIPESEGGKGGIPGLPADIGEGGPPSDELTELPLFGGETDKQWADREQMYNNAVAQCKGDRQKFIGEIITVAKGASALASHSPIGVFQAFPEDLGETIKVYNRAAKATFSAKAQMTEFEKSAIKAYNKQLATDVGSTLKLAKSNGAKALKQKAKLFA